MEYFLGTCVVLLMIAIGALIVKMADIAQRYTQILQILVHAHEIESKSLRRAGLFDGMEDEYDALELSLSEATHPVQSDAVLLTALRLAAVR